MSRCTRLKGIPVVMVTLLIILAGFASRSEAQVTVASWSLRYVEGLVDAFNAQNNGVTAEAVALSGDATKTRLAAGTGPDIIMYHVGHFDYSWESQWADLTAVVEAENPSDWVPGVWEALTFPHGDYAGQIRRIKSTYEIPVLYYDKDKFASAGLYEPATLAQEGRWTWEAMLDTAKKLTRDMDGDGHVDVWGIAHDPSFGWNNSGYYEIWGLQSGQYFVNEDGHYTGNHADFVDAVQWWADLYHVHQVSPAPRPGITHLPAGTAGMTIYGTHAHTQDNWQGYTHWDIAPLPNLPDNRPYNYVFEHAGWVVNADSDNMDETMEFVRFLLSDEAVRIMTQETGFFPARLTSIGDYVTYQSERYPWADNLVRTLYSTVENTMMPSKPGPWYVPNWRQIVDQVTAAVRSVQMGEAPAALALEQIAGPIQRILDDGWDQMIPGF